MSKPTSGIMLVCGIICAMIGVTINEDIETASDILGLVLAVSGIAMFFIGALNFSRGDTRRRRR